MTIAAPAAGDGAFEQRGMINQFFSVVEQFWLAL
jgi:hypothetical protein